MRVRATARALLPRPLRLGLKLLLGRLADYRNGDGKIYARPAAGNGTAGAAANFAYRLDLSQPIKRSELVEIKIHNLRIATGKIEEIVIGPGELFSFWRVVGRPTWARGYRKGRSLIEGRLVADYGGGLCQLSGIVYHLALIAGLAVRERHNHSVDIYAEDERFAPLGTDATVVYGYKDLRIQNNYDFPIRFAFTLDDRSLGCSLESGQAIAAGRLVLERNAVEGGEEVVTKRVVQGREEFVARSHYKRQEP